VIVHVRIAFHAQLVISVNEDHGSPPQLTLHAAQTGVVSQNRSHASRASSAASRSIARRVAFGSPYVADAAGVNVWITSWSCSTQKRPRGNRKYSFLPAGRIVTASPIAQLLTAPSFQRPHGDPPQAAAFR
jgi:hypothetical protein